MLVRTSLRNPYAVIVMAIGIFVISWTVVFGKIPLLGLSLGKSMPLDILPQFKTPAVQILTLYPGMPTEIVERDITNRLERWTSQSMGIAWQESRSMVGVSIVRDYFREDIDPNTAMSQVSALAISDLYYLPPGTIPPMVMLFDPTAMVSTCLVAVSSDTLDETQVYDIAYFEMRNLLSGAGGTIAPAVFGGRLRRIYVYVDPHKLQARQLSPMDVVNALTQFNLMIPTGNAKIGDKDYAINTESMVPNVRDLNDIPVKIEGDLANGDARPVFIKDIGTAKDTYAIQTNVVRISRPPSWQSKRQVYIPIYRQPGANSIAVVEGVKWTIDNVIKPRIPKELNIDVVADQTVFIRKAINALVKEGVLGALLAALMILVFLGNFRSTLIVSLSVPLSIGAALIGLYFTGDTINSMTLGGLALALGRLVDDSIVVLENTDRHMKMGKPPMQAALDAALEVVATITTVAVFVPVMFLTGIGKFLFTPLAFAVGFSMAASYVMSMTIVPAYCAYTLTARLPLPMGEGEKGSRGIYEHLREGYGRLLSLGLWRKGVLLASVAGLFVASLFLYPFIGKELFPEMDSGQMMVQVRLPSGTRIEKTEQVVARVEKAIQELIPKEDREIIISNIGVLYDWPAAYTPNGGPHDAFIIIQRTLKGSKKTVQESAELLREKLPPQFPGVQFAFNTGGIVTAALNFGLPSPIDIQIEGKSLETLYGLARQVKAIAQQVPGAVDVRIQQELDYPQINIKVDRQKAAYLGLTQEDVVKNIVTALNSSVNFKPSFWLDYQTGNHYFVGATYREEDIESFETLENIPITSPKQKEPVLLKNIATLERTTVPTEIAHYRIRRVMDVFVNVSGRAVGDVAAEIERRVRQQVKVPDGYFIHFRGEVASMRESFRNLGFAFVLAAILIYLIMVAQFKSFVDPFIIMFAVPLGLIGVLGTLFVTGTTLNIQSFMGTIFMVGISVSNSILLVEFANRLRREEGMALHEAVVEAAKVRLRPILMTSLAAVIALMPMALAKGEAAMPLARAVIGGLSVSTALTLFVVPALYEMLKRERGQVTP